jgi:predicted Fe-Mo cluster-binding NifX family protein
MRELDSPLTEKTSTSDAERVCIPTAGYRGLDETVSEHFGRAPTFTIINPTTNEVKVIPNTGQHMGGKEHTPQIIAHAGVDLVLCSHLGPRATTMLQQLGIRTLVGASGNVSEVLQAWKEGKLEQATLQNACERHRHPAHERISET